MATPTAARRIDYERVLQAVGRLVEERRLRDICILQVEGGLVLQGQELISTKDGYQLVSRTRVLGHEDLDRLTREL
jgi:hypothetical protein